MSMIKKQGRSFVLFTLAWALVSCVWASGNIDPNSKYAWSENIGWVNFAPSNGGGNRRL